MNQLFQGDNLAILRNMPDESVDLICTDPPFNTGKDWGAFNDKWVGGLKGYLKFMKPRLIECRRVLKDTGSLYLHSDPKASHYLKVMLDWVFGIDNFRNEIVWCYRRRPFKVKDFQKMHDIILRYAKSDNWVWNQLLEDKSPSTIKRFGVRKLQDIDTGKGRKHVASGEITPETAMRDIWNIPIAAPVSKQRVGYPTQKPVALYERIIKASSNQHDIVLDPFAGSGTTLDAAHTLGRHWIGVDVGDAAIETIQERMRNRHGLEYDRDYEIIRGT